MVLRAMTIEDYHNLTEFWKTNYLLTKLDDFERMDLFIKKNPDLSIVAENEGTIIGTVLVSFDGRRGSLQKVVVSQDSRGKGIGKKLVKEAVKRLQSIGALDIRFNTAEELVSFYEKCGFKKDSRPSMIIKTF